MTTSITAISSPVMCTHGMLEESAQCSNKVQQPQRPE